MPAKLTSRIPEIQVELPAKVGAAIHAGTERLAGAVKERAPVGNPLEPDNHPGELRDSVQVTDPKYGYTTNQSAGVSMQFYWYFLEYGTVHMAPQPFVRAAAVASYGQIYADVVEAIHGL